MIAWIKANIIPALIIAAVIIVLAVFAWNQWQSASVADTRAELAEGQRGAAIESGADAVETIGNTQAHETEIHSTVKDATEAINAAPAGDSNDTAERAVCGMKSYRYTAKCIALLGDNREQAK